MVNRLKRWRRAGIGGGKRVFFTPIVGFSGVRQHIAWLTCRKVVEIEAGFVYYRAYVVILTNRPRCASPINRDCAQDFGFASTLRDWRLVEWLE